MKLYIRQSMLAIILLFPVFVKAQTAATWEIATWHQFKPAAVSYTFDDNCSNQMAVALPLFDQYQFKVTFYTIVNNQPDWVALLKASQRGHEVASHTLSHPMLDTMTLERQDQELRNSQLEIQNKAKAPCMTLAYPFCHLSDLKTTQKYYIAARHCHGHVESKTPKDFYSISSIVTGAQGQVKVAADFNQQVTEAKKTEGWCVFLLHSIDGDGCYSSTSSLEIGDHLQFMHAHPTDYWVAPFVNVVKYIRERNSLEIKELATSKSTLQISLNDGLADAIYNEPITIRRILPNNWTNATVEKQGLPVGSKVINEQGKNYLVFDVVPDNFPVIISRKKRK